MANGFWSGADPRIVTLRRKRDEARAERDRYREALEFYSNAGSVSHPSDLNRAALALGQEPAAPKEDYGELAGTLYGAGVRLREAFRGLVSAIRGAR